MSKQVTISRDGARYPVAPWFKSLSKDMQSAIGRSGYKRDAFDLKRAALAYAETMLTLRGIAIPNGDCRPEIVSAAVTGEKKPRVKAVVWNRHVFNRRTHTHDYTEVLRFEIPHWDHVPSVTEIPAASYAMAA